ncbi:MAG TPA: response regulator [Candidatus Xenobia bacterium]
MRERILLVDDEKPFCLTLKRALERRGYRVDTAFDGKSAIALAQELAFDLMVVDVRMPDISGIEALQAVKDVQPRVEGIVITGYASYEAPVNAIKLGVRDYLGKPFELDEFLASIERVLGQARETRQRTRQTSRARQAYLESLRLLARSFGPPCEPNGRARSAAVALGLGRQQADQVEILAALTRLGRTEKLTDMGRERAREHWMVLQEALEPVDELRGLLPVLLALYERFDGQGFPDALQGEEIPLAARVMTAAAVRAEGAEADGWLDPSVVEALEVAAPEAPEGDSSSVLEAQYASLLRLAAAYREAGDPHTAAQALDLASAAAARMGDPQKQASCLVQQAHLRSGQAAWEAIQQAREVARSAGPTVLAHVRVEEARICQALGRREEAEVALREVHSQFERWQWRYQAVRTRLLLADVYREWRPAESAACLDGVLQACAAHGFDDLLVWEWALAGPLVAGALGTSNGADRQRLLSVLERVGPAALSLWNGSAAPADVRVLFDPSEDAPAGMRLQCLGEFRVMVGTEAVPESAWHGKKSKNLFSYLVLQQGRLVSQDVLLEVFWPDATEERGRHALHQAVHRLRKGLESVAPGTSSYVVQQADTYGFDTKRPYLLDVETFDKQFSRARSSRELEAWLEAERVYGGELLANAPYEDWCGELRDRCQQKYLEVLSALAAGYEAGGQLEAASDFARRLFGLDMSREESARLLMRLLWQAGRRDDALKVYAQCAKVLQEEVGVAPLPETRQLYEKILRGMA